MYLVVLYLVVLYLVVLYLVVLYLNGVVYLVVLLVGCLLCTFWYVVWVWAGTSQLVAVRNNDIQPSLVYGAV